MFRTSVQSQVLRNWCRRGQEGCGRGIVKGWLEASRLGDSHKVLEHFISIEVLCLLMCLVIFRGYLYLGLYAWRLEFMIFTPFFGSGFRFWIN